MSKATPTIVSEMMEWAWAHIPARMPARYAVMELAAKSGATLERRHCGRLTSKRGAALYLRQPKILVCGKGTEEPDGIVTVAHEIGHLLLRQFGYSMLTRGQAEACCEAFGRELAYELELRWHVHLLVEAQHTLPLAAPGRIGCSHDKLGGFEGENTK